MLTVPAVTTLTPDCRCQHPQPPPVMPDELVSVELMPKGRQPITVDQVLDGADPGLWCMFTDDHMMLILGHRLRSRIKVRWQVWQPEMPAQVCLGAAWHVWVVFDRHCADCYGFLCPGGSQCDRMHPEETCAEHNAWVMHPRCNAQCRFASGDGGWHVWVVSPDTPGAVRATIAVAHTPPRHHHRKDIAL